MIVIGIDPGASGAIAAVTDTGRLLAAEDMPVVDKQVSAPLLRDVLRSMGIADGYDIRLVVIERVHSMPKQGVASSFKFGHAYGVALGVVGGLGYRSMLVTPQAWKKAMGATADKDRTRRLAIERWPEQADLFKLKKHDGRAEAALMAAHGINLTPMNHQGEPS